MRTPVTVVAFFVGLAVLFAVAVSLGNSVGSLFGLGRAAPPEHDYRPRELPPEYSGLGGLAIADQGYALWPSATRFGVGETTELRFNIFTVDRLPVTEFAVEQDKRMHLVLVRRDMTQYQHLHPTMTADGTWKVRLRFDEPGSYRAFATFRPETTTTPVILGVDLDVPGLVELGPVSQPADLAELDGYSVMRTGEAIAGGVTRLYLKVMRDGEPVTDLEPYLGARGHLVMLREGDLAYLRVHPVPSTSSGPTVTFEAGVPTPGYYRLFFDFKHQAEVRTAEFTVLAS